MAARPGNGACFPDAVQRKHTCAQRCTAGPGSFGTPSVGSGEAAAEFWAIPGLQRTTSCCAAPGKHPPGKHPVEAGQSSVIRRARPARTGRQRSTGEPHMSTKRHEVYKQSGVDTAEADSGLRHIVERVQATWPRTGQGRVALPIGYFANVIEVDGIGIALCTDGVGSKTIIAHELGKYDTIGIDCVAMNVNDMICVRARPLSMVDYIAIDKADAAMLDAIGAGLCRGAEMAQISISGGETAQLKDIVTGFDLVGMAVGRVDLDKIVCGRDVKD